MSLRLMGVALATVSLCALAAGVQRAQAAQIRVSYEGIYIPDYGYGGGFGPSGITGEFVLDTPVSSGNYNSFGSVKVDEFLAYSPYRTAGTAGLSYDFLNGSIIGAHFEFSGQTIYHPGSYSEEALYIVGLNSLVNLTGTFDQTYRSVSYTSAAKSSGSSGSLVSGFNLFLGYSGGVQGSLDITSFTVTQTPLPASLPMFGAALLVLGGAAFARRRSNLATQPALPQS